MNLSNVKYIYFLGIGGIGMSALARYFNAAGKTVCGYDKTPTPLTGELIQEGINVHFTDDINIFINEVEQREKSQISNLKSQILIVLTPAVPKDHSELNYFINNGFTIKKRSQVLGDICAEHFTIGVAGTHGKTTTSSLIAHILKASSIDLTAFLGGITQNYNTNLLLSQHLNSFSSQPSPCVVEADEYDRSFLTLFPDMAVITSLDADHLDIYGSHDYMKESYQLYADQVKENGVLILKEELPIKNNSSKKVYTYSLRSQTANYHAKNIIIKNGEYFFDIVTPSETIKNIAFGLPGWHNVENAIAATAIALQYKISSADIKNALASFKGVRRRFDYKIKSDRLVFIDDYAHHPQELAACITSVKELYPDKKITGIFQPHLYTRTRDFADGFAESLSLLDELILMDIYPARELPIEGVTSQMLLDKMQLKNKVLCGKTDLLNEVKKRNIEVLLTLGAGDIDQFVEPIKNILEVK